MEHRPAKNKCCRLEFAKYEDPVLHKATETVKFPLSAEDQQIIADMLYSLEPEQLTLSHGSWSSAAGMAANQWGISKRIFLYSPYGSEESEVEVVINPSYEPLPTSSSDYEWEGCFSIPLATGNVKRYTDIKVKYQNQAGEVIQRKLSDWEARVWQHENDHLNGFLYDSPKAGKCKEKHEFSSNEELEEFYAKIREARKERE